MSTVMHRRRVRIVDYDRAELFCYGCHEFYPLTMEFWPCRSSFSRCRACDRERSRLFEARRRFNPEYRAQQIVKSRNYRAYLRREYPELLDVEKRERRLTINLEQTARRQKLSAKESKRLRAARDRRWARAIGRAA